MTSSSMVLVGGFSAAMFGLVSETFDSIAFELAVVVASFGLALFFRRGGSGKQACGKVGSDFASIDKQRQRQQQCLKTERPHGKVHGSPSLSIGGEFALAQAHPNETVRLVHEICAAHGGLSAQAVRRLVHGFLEVRSSIADVVRLETRHSEVDFYTSLAQCVIRAGQPHLVEGILDDMSRDGITRPLAIYEGAMRHFAGQKQYQLALRLYDRLILDGLEPSAVTCGCLIGFASELGELDRAVGFFEKLSTISIPSIRAYMTVLRVHAKRHDWESSLALFRDMLSRGFADALALNVVLSTGVAVNRLDGVSLLLVDACGQSPCLVDTISFNTVIKGYAQQGDLGKALEVLERMRSQRCGPNAISFNTAMDAAVRCRKLQEAWVLLHQMQAAGLHPDKFSCSILIKGLQRVVVATTRQVECSLQLLQEAGSALHGPLKSTLFHTLLEVSAKKADRKLSMKVFETMCKEHVEPSMAARRLVGLLGPSK